MTCDSCESKVKGLLEKVPGVTSVKPDRNKEEAEITMRTHVSTSVLKDALKEHPRYQVNDKNVVMPASVLEEEKAWIETYKPVLLIFAYITGITLSIEYLSREFDWMRWMNHFMAGFFLTFSFFKLLNLQGFADSYATYDIIAKKWRGYGSLYAFIELFLGLAYLTNFEPVLTSAITFVVMSVSLVGVLQSVLNKRKIKCACLGDVFNLPMSTITIIEDALMILMSVTMLLYFYL